jgi:hypothetical protein
MQCSEADVRAGTAVICGLCCSYSCLAAPSPCRANHTIRGSGQPCKLKRPLLLLSLLLLTDPVSRLDG